MEVILKRDIEGLGKSGCTLKVKDGFARNFLLPKKLAVAATPDNFKKLEQEKLRKTQEIEAVKKESLNLKEKLEGLSLTIPALTQEGEEEKLYGSVNAQDIIEALKEEGFEIDKNCLLL